MERIEFCFFDAGGGHRAAATALEMALRGQERPWEIRLTNVQELLDPLDVMRKYAGIRIQDVYNTMLRNGWTLGSAQLMRVLQMVMRMYHRPTVRLLESHWKETQPDLVVSFVPHFNRALNGSLQRALPGTPFVTVLTDFADYPPHFWIEREPQYFICGTDKAVAQAHAMGHAEERVFRASGMILHPRFYENAAASGLAAREGLGLRSDLPTGLVLFGGHGSKAMLEIARRLNRSKLDLQLILICGKNEALVKELKGLAWRVPHFIEGFTTRVNDYMRASDFFIGKPGPGSLSEALAMHLPVIVECNAWTLPQERYNTAWVVEKEVGIVLHNFAEIEGAVARMIEPAALARYRANTAKIENRAVFEIADILDTILQSRVSEVAR